MMKSTGLLTFFLFSCLAAWSQSASDYAVRVSAVVQASPPEIQLNWPLVTSTTIDIYRKLKSDNAWGNLYASLPGTAVQFTDTAVSAGVSYEYKLVRPAGSYYGYGYINAGIEVELQDQKGILLLLVDDAFTNSLSSELQILKQDIEADGWLVRRFDISDTLSVDSVKALIRSEYQTDTLNVKAVFMVGHIPVPYSGSIAPDGHSNHIGAWPADVFYGDMNGTWTDLTVNTTVASDPRNDNIPGDGKYDQSTLPSDVELQVGRVDFSNLPAFAASEEDLLRAYLQRNHDFRSKVIVPQYRALIDDNFGAFGGEAFSASAWKNFAPLVGSTNTVATDYRTALDTGSYIWSYGCGGGSFTSCGGVGTTADFSGDSLQTIFTMLFGSYFGDWDRSDNLMRAALASGTTLSISWSGRPHWMYHHMALGENIGYNARLTQNNSNFYYGNNSVRYIHIALLGDPTLRMHAVRSPAGFTAGISGQHALMSWIASPDSVLGYHVYRRMDTLTHFTRINQQLITGTSYTDSCLLDSGLYHYMVRAVTLEVTPSGSYYNLSPGESDTALLEQNGHVLAAFTYTISNDTLTVTSNTSVNGTGFLWNFGDGGSSSDSLPAHVYTSNGNYQVTLWTFSSCDGDSLSQSISITTGINEEDRLSGIRLYPNPSGGILNVERTTGAPWKEIQILSPTGNILHQSIIMGEDTYTLNLENLLPGIYVLKFQLVNGLQLFKKVVII